MADTNPYPFGYPPYSETVSQAIMENTVTNTTPTPVTKSPGIWSGAFWKGAGERALKTAAQTFVAVVGVTGIGTTLGLGNVNWTADLSVSAVATLLSFVTSIGNADFTAGN